ncbi:unnamed protein product, partial [Brassica oleracea var. botrytis]
MSKIRSLGKLKESPGENIGPWNLLERRTIICKLGNIRNQKGNVSLTSLSSTFRNSSLVQFIRDLGSSPDNLLRPTSRDIKLALKTSSGILPERLLFRRCKTE